jgi:hypothetical protein
VGVVLLGGGAIAASCHDRGERRAAEKRLGDEEYRRWSDRRSRVETATDEYIHCAMGRSAQPVRDAPRLKKALAQQNRGGYATFGQRVRWSCSPALRGVVKEMEGVRPVPPVVASEWTAYLEKLAKFAASLESYADAAARHADEDRSHEKGVGAARAWSQATDAGVAATGRVEEFLACAAPGLTEAPNKEGLMRWIHTACVSADPAAFMRGVVEKCNPYLDGNTDAGASKISPEMLAALERFRGERIGSIGAVPMMLMACTEAVRKTWVEADSASVVESARNVFVARADFQIAVEELKPAPDVK